MPTRPRCAFCDSPLDLLRFYAPSLTGGDLDSDRPAMLQWVTTDLYVGGSFVGFINPNTKALLNPVCALSRHGKHVPHVNSRQINAELDAILGEDS